MITKTLMVAKAMPLTMGAKSIDYASAKGISTPFYVTMTKKRIKAIENNGLDG